MQEKSRNIRDPSVGTEYVERQLCNKNIAHKLPKSKRFVLPHEDSNVNLETQKLLNLPNRGKNVLEFGERNHYIESNMTPSKKLSTRVSSRSIKERHILLVRAAPDLVVHASSLNHPEWKIKEIKALPEKEQAFMAVVDGQNVELNEFENKILNHVTVYLNPRGTSQKSLPSDPWFILLDREQFLKTDFQFLLSLFSGINEKFMLLGGIEEKYRLLMRQAQLGKALQSIVHNVNNQLAPVLAVLETIQKENVHIRDLAMIYEQCQRIHSDFANLLRVSRRGLAKEVSGFDLNALIREELRLMMGADPVLQSRVVCHTQLDTELPPLFGIYNDFSHSFINLLRNAASAMARTENPELTIRTGQNAKNIWLEVEDRGIGIPEHFLKDMFKPYVSSCERRKGQEDSGLGLGLSSSKELLDKYKVKWEVKSRVGVGTRFVLKFPRDKICIPPEDTQLGDRRG